MCKWVAILVFMLTSQCMAVTELYTFKNTQERERYYQLIDSLRCLVCQNQTLAASQAPLAIDLKNEVYRMVRDGDSNQAITHYLVQRYGDFVLYKPPLQKNTYVLWLLPLILLVFGFIKLFQYMSSSKQEHL